MTARSSPHEDPAQILDEMNEAWRQLWKRLQRLHGDAARGYVKIVELTATGTPHLHVAVSMPYTSQRWLADSWSELTGWFIVDIRAITSERGAARYLSKYLTKQHGSLSARRRWSTSAGFLGQAPLEAPSGGPDNVIWTFTFDTTVSTLQRLRSEGWALSKGWWRSPVLTRLGPPGSARGEGRRGVT